MTENEFPTCLTECEFRLKCGRFDRKQIMFYCLKLRCIYLKKKEIKKDEIHD